MILKLDNMDKYEILDTFQKRTKEVIEVYLPVFDITLGVVDFCCTKCTEPIINFSHTSYHEKERILEIMYQHYQTHLPYIPPEVNVR